MAKARADEEQGIPRAELDVVNFVLTNDKLSPEVRAVLAGSNFNVTSLKRLIETKEVQDRAGFSMQAGRLVTEQDEGRMRNILTEVATIIATGKHDGEKFTERNIDSLEKREDFIEKVLKSHPKVKKSKHQWQISGTPKATAPKPAKPKVRSTPSTEERQNLIPKKFRLELPSGKVNDIFIELKELDATKRRHAVSVLLRVFIEFSLADYIKKHKIAMPTDKQGHVIDKLSVRLSKVKEHVKASKLMSDKEMQPVNVAIGDNSSILGTDSLNAYVHSEWMNPDPLRLKTSWNNLQLFLERLWGSKNTAGQE